MFGGGRVFGHVWRFGLVALAIRQRPTLMCHVGGEQRVVLLDDPIEQRLLGLVALVTASARLLLTGAPWRCVV